MPAPSHRTWRRLWPAALPLVLALLVYARVGGFAFFNLDDDQYVTGNAHVLGGLSAEGLRWAVAEGHEGVWIPATWLSLQADASLQGPGPAGFHRTNLALHLANVVLVYLLMLALTGGGRGRALVVAAVFAVHPLNAEAVCWVTARKDLLAAAWSLGAALCWHRAGGAWRRGWAWGALACAVVAMTAKPQAVALPALLVLVAQWRRDEDRWAPGALGRDVVAVLPFLAVAAAIAVAAFRLAHGQQFGTMTPVPLGDRIFDAAGFVWRYLLKLVRPTPLAPVYPAVTLDLGGVRIAALFGLLASLAAAWHWRRACAACLFGWLWFLAWLLPTLGLVQGGQLPLGDRYAYLAMVGVVFAVAELAAQAMVRKPQTRVPLLALAVALVGLGAAQSWRQAGYWRDPITLWTHTLAVTRDNALAEQGLGVALDEAHRPAEAWPHLQRALALHPLSRTHFNAGNVLLELGRKDEAAREYRMALALDPSLVQAALNLGSLLGQEGKLAEARAVLLQAERAAPDLASVQFNLGLVAWLAGDRQEAEARLRRTLELDPGHVKARELLARMTTG